MVSLFAPVAAAKPGTPTEQVMYANGFTAGAILPINIAPYTEKHPARLNPANVLGVFDATQSAPVPGQPYNPNEHFFGLAAREWTNYTFEDQLRNVTWAPDIEFAEVTWGSGWHIEAAKVYLTDAYVQGADGSIASYGQADDGIGYYAGVVWNKEGINRLTGERRLQITKRYFAGDREFGNNTFATEGNFGVSQFNLPDEVVYAAGVALVDITSEVYQEGTPATYLTAGGARVTLREPYGTPITPGDVTVQPNMPGNTDGFDLDAIRVYRSLPHTGDDTATGVGKAIGANAKWFMYNEYSGEAEKTYLIQAGNPKNGQKIVGCFKVVNNGNGTYTVTYAMDPAVTIVDEHLGISDKMNFSAVPGQDDNQDYGVPFADSDGKFYIFAHFAVTYQ
jgi:hypothetical protein